MKAPIIDPNGGHKHIGCAYFWVGSDNVRRKRVFGKSPSTCSLANKGKAWGENNSCMPWDRVMLSSSHNWIPESTLEGYNSHIGKRVCTYDSLRTGKGYATIIDLRPKDIDSQRYLKQARLMYPNGKIVWESWGSMYAYNPRDPFKVHSFDPPVKSQKVASRKSKTDCTCSGGPNKRALKPTKSDMRIAYEPLVEIGPDVKTKETVDMSTTPKQKMLLAAIRRSAKPEEADVLEAFVGDYGLIDTENKFYQEQELVRLNGGKPDYVGAAKAYIADRDNTKAKKEARDIARDALNGLDD